MNPTLLLGLLAIGTVASVARRRSQRRCSPKATVRSGRPAPRCTTTTRPGPTKKGVPLHTLPQPPEDPPELDDSERQAAIYTAWQSKEAIEARLFDLPTGLKWEIEVMVFAPAVRGGVQWPGVGTFGYAAGPPESGGPLDSALTAITDVAVTAAPAAGAAVQAYGVPPGVVEAAVAVIKKVLTAIPEKIARGRVKTWLEWREGQYGKSEERKRMQEEVASWRDINWRISARMGFLCEYWRFEAVPSDDSRTEFALVSTEDPPQDMLGGRKLPRKDCSRSAPPSVWSDSVTDGWARVSVRLEPTELGVSERRYSIVARPR